MGVVELHGNPVRKLSDVTAGQILHQVQDVLKRAGHEEVLLQQTQLLARLGLVVGVEHLGDRLGDHLLLDRAVVVAGIEGVEGQFLHRACTPQGQGVAVVHPVALDGCAVVHALDGTLRNPAHPLGVLLVAVVLSVAAPHHAVVQLRLDDFPGVALGQPVVGLLDLPAVADVLIEDAEFVADAVADRRALQSGQRVQVAGRQSAEAAVAQTGLLLAGQHRIQFLAQLGQSGACLGFDL